MIQDYPPPEFSPDFKPEDYFGPDERFQILAELFNISLEKSKSLAIEPPFRCDYGTNIEFKGDFYSNFNFIVSDLMYHFQSYMEATCILRASNIELTCHIGPR